MKQSASVFELELENGYVVEVLQVDAGLYRTTLWDIIDLVSHHNVMNFNLQGNHTKIVTEIAKNIEWLEVVDGWGFISSNHIRKKLNSLFNGSAFGLGMVLRFFYNGDIVNIKTRDVVARYDATDISIPFAILQNYETPLNILPMLANQLAIMFDGEAFLEPVNEELIDLLLSRNVITYITGEKYRKGLK